MNNTEGKFILAKELINSYEYVTNRQGKVEMVKLTGLALVYEDFIEDGDLDILTSAAVSNPNLHIDVNIKGRLKVENGKKEIKFDKYVEITARALDKSSLTTLHKAIPVDNYSKLLTFYNRLM